MVLRMSKSETSPNDRSTALRSSPLRSTSPKRSSRRFILRGLARREDKVPRRRGVGVRGDPNAAPRAPREAARLPLWGLPAGPRRPWRGGPSRWQPAMRKTHAASAAGPPTTGKTCRRRGEAAVGSVVAAEGQGPEAAPGHCHGRIRHAIGPEAKNLGGLGAGPQRHGAGRDAVKRQESTPNPDEPSFKRIGRYFDTCVGQRGVPPMHSTYRGLTDVLRSHGRDGRVTGRDARPRLGAGRRAPAGLQCRPWRPAHPGSVTSSAASPWAWQPP